MTKQNFPSSEEIQSEFESFFKDKFGSQVKVFSANDENEKSEEIDTNAIVEDIRTFSLKPKDIKNHLDDYVIGQDAAKKALAIAVCDHYNHVKSQLHNPTANENYSKQNVLILGPTGVGKSYLIKHIAQMIGVPFVKADATRFSETGYMGANVDDLIKDLVKQADDDIEMAQFGIVYLDEADKLAASSDRGGKDVSGRGVQFGLLKIMEESEVDLNSGNDMAAQMQAFMDFQKKGKMSKKVVNTRFILFIVSGAFTGLKDIITDRLKTGTIGFAKDKKSDLDTDNIFELATTGDLINFGFEPEFVGRLPIRVDCKPLSVDDLFHILKNSKGSIVNQYRDAFRAYNIDAHFTDDALLKIAELAHKQKTGARALMTVCESVLRDFKFELPSTYLQKFEINAEVIENPEDSLKKLLETAPSFDAYAFRKEVSEYQQTFADKHGLQLHFTDAAVAAIARSHNYSSEGILSACQRILEGYEHGFKLIHQNTGKTEFTIDEKAIKDPKSTLEKWIKDSYT